MKIHISIFSWKIKRSGSSGTEYPYSTNRQKLSSGNLLYTAYTGSVHHSSRTSYRIILKQHAECNYITCLEPVASESVTPGLNPEQLYSSSSW